MSDPHRAAPGVNPDRTDGIAVSIRPALRSFVNRRGPLMVGAVVALLLMLGVAGDRVFAQSPPRVTVQPGETLSAIALRHYGDAAEVNRIAAANRILNPDLVLAGSVLQLPARESAIGGMWVQTDRTITVAPGDTLSAIALRVYGSIDFAPALAAANGISHPDLIRTGQELTLPPSLRVAESRGAVAGGSGGGLAGSRICIDPGHGGADPGAVFTFDDGRMLRESDAVLDISVALAQRLRAQGATVILTRERDLTLDLPDRAYRCNVSGAEIAVSVHLNGVEDRSINGALALYAKPSDQPLAEVMARVLQSGLFGTGRIDATDFGARHFGGRILLYTNMPAVLVEPAFLTNPIEAQALLAPASDPSSRRAQIARELERGIEAYLR